MEYPRGYKVALLRDENIATKWPNLQLGVNSEITSYKDTEENKYNCVAFALGEENKIADMLIFSHHVDLKLAGLPTDALNHSVESYEKIFQYFYKFERCDSKAVEQGYDKIALFEGVDEDEEVTFLHVALQLEDGRWKSKMGGYEDIEHDTLSVLTGIKYGYPKIIMKREKGLKINILPDDDE